jgi:ABC-type transport system involved in multi-copper enzyme maturation permease subunit
MLGPIFLRECLTLPRRQRHYVMRTVYLGALWILGLTAWQVLVGWEQTATLGDNARFGLILFQVLTFVQLTVLLFFAALSAASTITQEKDRRTFLLLLLTDLRNYEIVLGKLLGSLLQIALFLGGMVPVLALLMLLGGVSGAQVLQATVVLAATALAAGSLGGLVALWRDKTFQALALTTLLLVLYLCLVHALAVLPFVSERLVGPGGAVTPAAVEAWQTWLQPFLALQAVVEPPADNAAGIAPAYGFALAMGVISVLVNGWAILRLRVWNPSGEPIMQREQPEEEEAKDRARAHAAPGPVRRVWPNPILWREIATRAYGRRPLLVKAAYFLVLGLVCYYALAPVGTRHGRTEWAAAMGLVPVGILSLLLVSAQAVTAITSERDTGALDLLLVTDLTPKEFIFGKIGGILYNTKEYLLAPLVLAVVYAARGQLASPPPRFFEELLFSKNFEAGLAVVACGIILLAFTIMLGMHVALRTESSRLAVIHTLGTVFFLSVGTLVCIGLILINGRFEYQFFSFIFFIAAACGGMWWVLNGDRPTGALTLAALLCPTAVFYTALNILIGRPGLQESTDPLIPFLVAGGTFSFTLAAMLIPLLSEFDVALGRTTGGGE